MLQKELEKYDDLLSQLNGALRAIFTKLQLKKEVISLYDNCNTNYSIENCKVESVQDTGIMFKAVDSEKKVFVKYYEFPHEFVYKSNSGRYEFNCNAGIY